MTQNLRMYRDLAGYYDIQYATKDYRSEVRRLEALVRRYCRSGSRSWLDVACGTGRHLELLRPRHDCVGVDVSPEMLAIARGRLPGIPLVRGDMRTFDLGRQFDVISCLFSAIGHLTTEREVGVAFANFARHLKPGGVVIVEPWLRPSRAKPGHVHLITFPIPRGALVRMAFSKIRGHRTVIDFHFLIGERGRGIRYVKVTDRGLMIEAEHLAALLRRAGLRPRFLARGFVSDRGLLIGTKSARGFASSLTSERRPRGPAPRNHSPSAPRPRRSGV